LENKNISEKIMAVLFLHGKTLNELTEFLDNVEKKPPDVKLASQLIEIEEHKSSSSNDDDVDIAGEILKNLYYLRNKNSDTSADSERLKVREVFLCLDRFIELFCYESGSYLRPIMSEIFPTQYLKASIDMGFGCYEKDEKSGVETFVFDTINLFHTDVFDYFESTEEMIHFVRKLWVVSYVMLRISNEEATLEIIDLLQSIEKYALKIR